MEDVNVKAGKRKESKVLMQPLEKVRPLLFRYLNFNLK